MSSPSTLAWFARHELRLASREWLSMMTAGRRSRLAGLIAGLLVVGVFMHLVAYAVVGRIGDINAFPPKTVLIVVTASLVLSWALVLSQAIESVTRVFYTRADLDLIMSSPFALSTILSVRMAAVALTMIALALVMALPFVDVLVMGGGPQWLAAYGVTIALALSATAVGLLVTVALFRLCGPRRTRLVAQVVSALVGAGFVITLQVGAIMSYGTMSRFAFLMSDRAARVVPDVGSAMWWPAQAILGNGFALLALLAAGFMLLGLAMMVASPLFGDGIASVAANTAVATSAAATRPFRSRSRQQALRSKELMLLRRDPWLVSQTLMQLLYLLPPAVMMWRSFASGAGAAILLVPVIVMAAGQLAGGIAWLSISGEDAPDLIATSPLSPMRVIRAKVEVVLIVIGMVLTPLLVPMAFMSLRAALIAACAASASAVSATAIQLWFRAQARRSQFRRRHTASRIATFAEAFASIGWAAAAALALVNLVLAAFAAAMTLAVLALAWAISPRRG